MKPIQNQAHHDGLGLADLLTVYSDERDPQAGNASHVYAVTVGPALDDLSNASLDDVTLPGDDPIADKPALVAHIRFQHGPRNESGSTPGILDGALIAILLDRFEGFQSGPYKCRENAIVITHLEEALMWMQKRARDRAKRGVLGTNKA